MRLLSNKSLTFEEFLESELPAYAILSHCWGDKEVPYNDMRKGRAQEGPGLEKIRNACTLAENDGYEWIWIDTCCIDKKSSAELSEAINSMFRWYSTAAICYAYLSDISPLKSRIFGESRWFTRGWTLQELIAPQNLAFFDENWKHLGDKCDLVEEISRATGIPSGMLNYKLQIRHICISEKMYWASRRVTSRPEDIAYCLLGLFDVNMPLLYGEGAKKAFIRLQRELLSISEDETIFLWDDPDGTLVDRSGCRQSGILAPHPRFFANSNNIINPGWSPFGRDPWVVTNKGLALPLIEGSWESDSNDIITALLHCHRKGDPRSHKLVFRYLFSEDAYVRNLEERLTTQMGTEISKKKEPAKNIYVLLQFE